MQPAPPAGLRLLQLAVMAVAYLVDLHPLRRRSRTEIDVAACIGSDLEVSPVLFEFVVDTSSTMAEVTSNSSGKSKWAVTRRRIIGRH